MPWIIIFLILFSQPTVNASVTTKQCQKVQPKIDKIQRKMRQGYKVKEGERLKKKLRKLEQLRYQCMKKRLPISSRLPN